MLFWEGAEVAQTEIIYDTLNPVWNEDFDFLVKVSPRPRRRRARPGRVMRASRSATARWKAS